MSYNSHSGEQEHTNAKWFLTSLWDEWRGVSAPNSCPKTPAASSPALPRFTATPRQHHACLYSCVEKWGRGELCPRFIRLRWLYRYVTWCSRELRSADNLGSVFDSSSFQANFAEDNHDALDTWRCKWLHVWIWLFKLLLRYSKSQRRQLSVWFLGCYWLRDV